MLDWSKAEKVKTDYADEVTRVTLPQGHVSFNLWPKDDYWLCWVQSGEDVIRADDVKYESMYGAKARAEKLYDDQWASLCAIDLLGARSG